MVWRLSLLLVFWSVLSGQNTYYGPVRPPPGRPDLIRVEITVQDLVGETNLKIVSARFNGQSIPLKPADIFGFRGGASFQLAPGKYKLEWVVNRDNFAWPRTVRHEETVHVDARDSWVQIEIVGEKASVL